MNAFKSVMSGSGMAGMQRPDVVQAILRLTGKAAAPDTVTVLYTGTATYDHPDALAQSNGLKAAGCAVAHLPMTARPEEAAALLAAADVVLISGGNTLFAVDRWRHMGVADMFAEAGARGCVLAGGSAGAICWFDAGHSDSGDPTSFRVVDPNLTAAEKAEWSYIRVPGLSAFPGLMCPHYDQVQSNGVRRSADFDEMMLRHPGERGLGLDHWCALVTEGDGSYSVLPCPGKDGSVLEDGGFSSDGSGTPGLWVLDVVDGVVQRTLAPAQGQLSDLLRPAGEIVVDPRADAVRGKNPAVF